ncbi:hypothetical protein EC973_007734 [Apophysomyces ossiformis]|uniref:FAR1 domain-containing protein n=1 Tax=Apophysomyces ossiformis TaxID=679940 RepID=A0A8H7BYS7_9FUNG|nr:hypothetical protein EC973_007734 [Apophysomyces ossiformis]
MPRRTDSQPSTSNDTTQGDPQAQGSEQSLEPFYASLINVPFADSVTAIEHCRDLCAQYGFTVKQEASTHRVFFYPLRHLQQGWRTTACSMTYLSPYLLFSKNIYVYCSREGLPDSLRNPKSNPQRKRPSKRCDCRWRVVLYENKGHWEFRKSQNPEAAKHNHELMRPEEIEKNWPKEVIDMICELARQRLTTQEIRTRVKSRFTDINWNERRFYNRLSEERQKIRQREAAARSCHLTSLWATVCMAAAGSEELSNFVEGELTKLFHTACQMAHIDPETLKAPVLEPEDTLTAVRSKLLEIQTGLLGDNMNQQQQTQSRLLNKFGETIPNEIETPPQPRSNRNNSSSFSSAKAAEVPKGFAQVVIPQHSYFVKVHTQRSLSDMYLNRNPRRTRSLSVADDDSAKRMQKKGKAKQQQSQQEEHHRLSVSSDTIQTLQPQIHRTASVSIPSPLHHQAPSTSFVYQSAYDSNTMPLESPLSGYVHPHFHHPYSMAPTSAFASSDMSFQFDPSSPTPVVRPAGNDPTVHPALQANPMNHAKTSPSRQTPTMAIIQHHPHQIEQREGRPMYQQISMSPILHQTQKSLPSPQQPPPPPAQPPQQSSMAGLYNKDVMSLGRTIIPVGAERPYTQGGTLLMHHHHHHQLSPSQPPHAGSAVAAAGVIVYHSDQAPDTPTPHESQDTDQHKNQHQGSPTHCSTRARHPMS